MKFTNNKKVKTPGGIGKRNAKPVSLPSDEAEGFHTNKRFKLIPAEKTLQARWGDGISFFKIRDIGLQAVSTKQYYYKYLARVRPSWRDERAARRNKRVSKLKCGGRDSCVSAYDTMPYNYSINETVGSLLASFESLKRFDLAFGFNFVITQNVSHYLVDPRHINLCRAHFSNSLG
jgi:hypothetical protein